MEDRPMKRTTLFAEEELLNEIQYLAEIQEKSAAEIMRQALKNYIEENRLKRPGFSFMGIGRSARKDLAEKHEELLWLESKHKKAHKRA